MKKRIMTEATLIARINAAIPEAQAVSGFEWDERKEGSGLIWLRGSGRWVDGRLVFDHYAEQDVHPTLQAVLDKAPGWIAEPNDAETLLLYRLR